MLLVHRMLMSASLLLSVPISTAVGQHTLEVTSNPQKALFHYIDIENFLGAWNRLPAASDSVEIFEREYFQPASVGLREYVRRYGLTANQMVESIRQRPEKYSSVGHLLGYVRREEPYFRSMLEKFAAVVPGAVFPPTYFLIEGHNAAASGSDFGQLVSIAAHGQNRVRIAMFLIHELTHMQSALRLGFDKYRAIYGPEKSLLAITVREGTAEFITYRLFEKITQERAHEYLIPNERLLWKQFEKEMSGVETGDWMFQFPTSVLGRSSNIGYALGAKIVESYYRNSTDPAAAMNEILTVVDYPEFLHKSGYAKRFENETRSLKVEPEFVFTINENDLIPEGIAYDPVDKCFYISSTHKRKILKIDAARRVTNFTQEAQDGLYGVVGMRVDAKRRLLWAAHGNVGYGMPMKNLDTTQIGFSGINKYDLTTGKLVKSYELAKPDEPHFLNDLTLDDEGRVYATDTRAQTVYTIDPQKDELEVFLQLPEGHFPNGIDITPDNRYLFVAAYADPKNLFGRIDIATKTLQVVELPEPWQAGADGLYYYNNSLIAILPEENSTDKIVQYILDASQLKVIDARMLIDGNPLLSQASTGVVVGNRLYFVATSNLQLFRKKYEETNGNVKPQDLPPVRIGMVELEEQSRAASELILVSNNQDHTVSLIDAATFKTLATLPVGKGPHEISVSPDRKFAYIANSGTGPGGVVGNSVTALDLERLAVKKEIELLGHTQPHDTRTSQDGSLVWAAVAPSKAILEIEASTGTIKKVWPTELEGGYFVAVTPDDNKLLVPHLEGKGITIFDRRTGNRKTLHIGEGQGGIDITPDGNEAWITSWPSEENQKDNQVSVLDISKDSIVASISLEKTGWGRAKIAPEGKRAIVVVDKTLYILSVPERKILSKVALSFGGKVPGISPDGRFAVISHPSDDKISIIDLTKNTVVRTLTTGKQPDGVAWTRVNEKR